MNDPALSLTALCRCRNHAGSQDIGFGSAGGIRPGPPAGRPMARGYSLLLRFLLADALATRTEHGRIEKCRHRGLTGGSGGARRYCVLGSTVAAI
jgi:hypothetical protein